MNFQTLGDLAQTIRMGRQHTQLKQQMERLSSELSTGRTADVTGQLSGNFGHLADIEHDLTVLERYKISATAADITSGAMQIALETIATASGDLGRTASIAGTTSGGLTLDVIGHQGRTTLETVIGALNTEVGGRSLFSGTAIDATPLADADTLLTEIHSTLTGASSAADVRAALDLFFDAPGGGFETLIYQGGDAYLSPYQLGDGQSVQLEIRADDTAMRGVLKHAVMAALVNDPALALSAGEQTALAQHSGEALLVTQDQVTGLRATLGHAQARVDQSAVRISAEMSSLAMARNNLLSVDGFQTATELENVQSQLEMLYTLTARASRLNLVNFLS